MASQLDFWWLVEISRDGKRLSGRGDHAVHMAGYLAVTAAVAVVIDERLGLQLLRRLWFNLDVMWAAALIATAAWTVWS